MFEIILNKLFSNGGTKRTAQKNALQLAVERQCTSQRQADSLNQIGECLGDQASLDRDSEIGLFWTAHRTFEYEGEQINSRTAVYPQLGKTDNDDKVSFLRKVGIIPDNNLSSEVERELNIDSDFKYFSHSAETKGNRRLFQYSSQPLEFMNNRERFANELMNHDIGEARVHPIVKRVQQTKPATTSVENRLKARKILSQNIL